MDKRNIKYLEPRKTILEQVRSGLIKVTLFLLITLMIFLFLIPFTLSVFLGDDLENIDDSDLILPKLEIASEENAFYDLEKIKDVYEGAKGFSTIEKYINGEEWNDEEIALILERNEKNLRYFDNSSDKNIFSLPLINNLEKNSADNNYLNNYRSISRVAVLRSLKSLKLGNDEQAFKEAWGVIKIGTLIETSQNDIVTYLYGIAIKKSGLEAMEKIINRTKVNVYRLGFYDEFLSKFETPVNISALKHEYLLKKKEIIAVAEGDNELKYFEGFKNYLLFNKYYFKPNKTIAIYADKYREVIKYFKDSCSVSTPPENFFPLFDSWYGMGKLYFTENVIGRFDNSINEIALVNVKNKACENQARLAGLRLMLDLKAYYSKNKELPNLLDDIKFNDSVEINDPLSGEEFDYSKNDKKLYSVGYDHQLGTDADIVFDIDYEEIINAGEIK